MGEPARKLDEGAEGQPYLRSVPGGGESSPRGKGHLREVEGTGQGASAQPGLRSIKGGGETTPTRAGHLRSVEDDETSGATPEQTDAEGEEATRVGDGDGSSSTSSKSKKNRRGTATPSKTDDKVGKGFTNDGKNTKGLRARMTNARNARKTAAALGIGGALIGGLIALFAFLIPFKLTHIVESIEQRVGEVPQYAIEQRLEFYVSRYLMIRSLEATGQFDFSPGGADRNRFTYLGNSFWDTMYTNWKGAKLEEKLASKHGVKLMANNNNPEIFRAGKLKATDFHLVDLNDASESIQPLERKEARGVIKQLSRDETRWHQVFKRWHIRNVLYKYYGVGKWKPFEKWRDDRQVKIRERKLAIKQRLTNETVGRLSERYAKYLNCLLEASAKECREALKKPDTDLVDPNDSEDRDQVESDTESDLDIDDADDALDDVADITSDAMGNPDIPVDKAFGKQITDKITEIGLKKIVASLATGIGIIDTLAHIYETVDSGVINQVIYDKNAQQYAAFGAPILSAAGQFVSGNSEAIAGAGDFYGEDVGAMSEMFNNFDMSPVYRAGLGVAGSQGERAWEDCDGNPDNGAETQLPAGEVVCPDKKLMVNRTEFTASAGWDAIGAILEPYTDTVGQIVGAITDITDSFLDAIGATDLISSLADKLGITDLLMRGFSSLLNWFAGPVITGVEEGGPAFGALYGAVTVAQSATGGDASVNKENTAGGAYLTNEQAAPIKAVMMEQHKRELQAQPFLARYFSPRIKESLTGQMAMYMPTNIESFTRQASAIFSSPISIFSSVFSTITNGRASALKPDDNPFDAIQTGFINNHPIFTANNGEGMNPDEIQTEYQCDKNPADRPQNSEDNMGRGPNDELAFDVPMEPDPCELEVVSLKAGTGLYDGKLGAADFDPLTDDSAAGGGGGGGTPVAPNGPCPSPEDFTRENHLAEGDMVTVTGAGATLQINPCIQSIVQNILDQAEAGGYNLSGSASFRSYDRQVELRRAHCGSSNYAIYEMSSSACSPPTARPGHSNHEIGTAIDFGCDGGVTSFGSTRCSPWLRNNNGFGLINLPSEPWHWSNDGS
jgi:hypothetical protein